MDINIKSWAINALKQLESDENVKFFIDVKNIENPQLTLVLLGGAQEGKTTLCLRLLGVELDKIPELSEKLRGCREIGESATPLPTIYYRCPEKYIIQVEIENKLEKQWICKDTNELEKIIQDIRIWIKDNFSRIENREIVMKIGLPYTNFDSKIARIVDLVGLNPRDPFESVLANHWADHWTAIADVIIFVICGRHLGSADIEKDFVKKWRIYKEKYLFLITFAFETASVREIFERSKEKSDEILLQEIQEYYKEELKRTLATDSLPPVIPVNLWKPEDIDEITWQRWERFNAMNLSQITEVMKGDPLVYRLRNAFNFYHDVEQSASEKEDNLRKELDILKKGKNSLEFKSFSLQEEIKEKKKWIKKYYEKVPDIIKIYKKHVKKLSEQQQSPEEKFMEKKERIVAAGYYFIQGCKNLIKKAFEEIKIEARKLHLNWDEVDLKAIHSLFGIKAVEIKEKLEKLFERKVFVPGFLGLGTNWDKSFRNYKIWERNLIKEIIQNGEKYIRNRINDLISKECEKLTSEIQNKKKILEEYKDQLQSIEKEIRVKEEELNDFLKKKDRALKIIRRYPDILKRNFVKFCNEIHQKIKVDIKERSLLSIIKYICQLYKTCYFAKSILH